MSRWVPFAIAIFMLTPFVLWGGMALLGPGGGLAGMPVGVGAVLLAASLPLAGLFWIQNLRQLGDSMGAPSRFGVAARLAALLPLAILLVGGAGIAWLIARGEGSLEPSLALAGTLVMAGFARLVARAPVEPGEIRAAPHAEARPGREDDAAHTILLSIANIAMALVLLAYYWTPWVLFWAVLALIPLAFVAIIAMTWWAAQTDVQHRAPPLRPQDAANDSRTTGARAA
jgi:hypothetical protein